MEQVKLVDTHCHLGYDELAGDMDAVLARSRAAGVCGWINVGTGIEQDRKVVQLSNKYDGMFAAVGIHPHYAKDADAESLAELERLAANDKVVAIGETGLDFHYETSGKDEQLRVFQAHLQIAKRLALPVIIHSRDAFEETLEVLKKHNGIGKVVFHCFSEDAAAAKRVLELGYYVSFTGVLTFKNAQIAREAVKAVPLERLMLETDCPYMSPVPVRSQKINEPAFMLHTAKFAAQLKGVDFEEFAAKITATSAEFFEI